MPVDFSLNTRPQADSISTNYKHPNSVVSVNGTKRLHNRFKFGSFHHAGILESKQLTHVAIQNPRT